MTVFSIVHHMLMVADLVSAKAARTIFIQLLDASPVIPQLGDLKILTEDGRPLLQFPDLNVST
jgi:hypothetical protein